MRSPTRRRLLALAGLTAVTVVSGSIAVADGPNADDIATQALLTEPVDAAAPTDVDVQEVVERARAVRSPVVPSRIDGVAVEPEPEPEPEPAPEPEPEPAPEPEPEPADAGTIWHASWYGPNFHGNLTANGEVFDQWAMTAAHKTLPFGTRLEVTNPSNGRSVVVRINDRGPFIAGRDLDLSRAAAEQLGIGGTSDVRVQVL